MGRVKLTPATTADPALSTRWSFLGDEFVRVIFRDRKVQSEAGCLGCRVSDVFPDEEKDRHYLNVGRIAAIFAACEDHAAYLLFTTRNGHLPENDEHLALAKHSERLRKEIRSEVDPGLADDLERFARYRNLLAHSVMRYDYVETEPDENGIRLITGFENHRTVNPRSSTPVPIPSDREIEERRAEMNLWCREVWIRAKQLTPET